MKKVLKWIKIQMNKVFKKTVSNIELLEFNLKEMKVNQCKIVEALYSYKGKVKYFQDTITEIENKISEIITGAKIVLKKGDDILLARCKAEIDILEDKKVRLVKSLELSNKLYEKAYIQKNMVSIKVSEIESRVDFLKMKSDFKKEVEEFSSVMNGEFGINMGEIEKDINIEFNASELKLADIEAEGFNINDILKNKDLEEFKISLKG